MDKGRKDESDKKIARVFGRLVLQGKMRTAVRWETERGCNVTLNVKDTEERTGLTVMEVLESNNPQQSILPVDHLLIP